MAITTPSDDIIVQEGTFAYSFQASGAVSGGAVLKATGTMKVSHAGATTTQGLVGVAAYEVPAGSYVAVYGPGNIVRCCASGTFLVGSILYPVATGKVDDYGTWGTNEPIGVALEASTADLQAVRVLLK